VEAGRLVLASSEVAEDGGGVAAAAAAGGEGAAGDEVDVGYVQVAAVGGRPIVETPACPVVAAFGYDGAADIEVLDPQDGGAGAGVEAAAAAAAVVVAAVEVDDDGGAGSDVVGFAESPAAAVDSNAGSFGSCHYAACVVAVAVADEVERDIAAADVVVAVDAGGVELFHPSGMEKSEEEMITQSLIGSKWLLILLILEVPVEWNCDPLSFSLLQY
jgi:hypothetical protein